MTAHCFGVHLHYRRQQQRPGACRPPPNHTNTYGNWSNSIKWTLNSPFGKWSIYSYHHRNSIGILAIENVGLPAWLGFYFEKLYWLFSISSIFADFYFWQLQLINFLFQQICHFFSKTETKSQFARDDPAFLVLLILCVFGKLIGFPCKRPILFDISVNKMIFFIVVTSIGFTWTLDLTIGQTIYCILYIIVVDVIIIGILTTTFTWFVANRYLREGNTEADIEWGYCFDVHLNAFFPSLVLLHFVQLIFFNSKSLYAWQSNYSRILFLLLLSITILFLSIYANCCCFPLL